MEGDCSWKKGLSHRPHIHLLLHQAPQPKSGLADASVQIYSVVGCCRGIWVYPP